MESTEKEGSGATGGAAAASTASASSTSSAAFDTQSGNNIDIDTHRRNALHHHSPVRFHFYPHHNHSPRHASMANANSSPRHRHQSQPRPSPTQTGNHQAPSTLTPAHDASHPPVERVSRSRRGNRNRNNSSSSSSSGVVSGSGTDSSHSHSRSHSLSESLVAEVSDEAYERHVLRQHQSQLIGLIDPSSTSSQQRVDAAATAAVTATDVTSVLHTDSASSWNRPASRPRLSTIQSVSEDGSNMIELAGINSSPLSSSSAPSSSSSSTTPSAPLSPLNIQISMVPTDLSIAHDTDLTVAPPSAALCAPTSISALMPSSSAPHPASAPPCHTHPRTPNPPPSIHHLPLPLPSTSAVGLSSIAHAHTHTHTHRHHHPTSATTSSTSTPTSDDTVRTDTRHSLTDDNKAVRKDSQTPQPQHPQQASISLSSDASPATATISPLPPSTSTSTPTSFPEIKKRRIKPLKHSDSKDHHNHNHNLSLTTLAPVRPLQHSPSPHILSDIKSHSKEHDDVGNNDDGHWCHACSTDGRHPRRCRCSVFLLFTIVSILSVVVGCVMVWLVGYFHTRDAIDTLAQEMRDQILDACTDELSHQFSIPVEAVISLHYLTRLRYGDSWGRDVRRFSNVTGWLADETQVSAQYPSLIRLTIANTEHVGHSIARLTPEQADVVRQELNQTHHGDDDDNGDSVAGLGAHIVSLVEQNGTSSTADWDPILYGYLLNSLPRPLPSDIINPNEWNKETAQRQLEGVIQPTDPPDLIRRMLGDPITAWPFEFNASSSLYRAADELHRSAVAATLGGEIPSFIGWSDIYVGRISQVPVFYKSIGAIRTMPIPRQQWDAKRQDIWKFGMTFAFVNIQELNALAAQFPFREHGAIYVVDCNGRVLVSSHEPGPPLVTPSLNSSMDTNHVYDLSVLLEELQLGDNIASLHVVQSALRRWGLISEPGVYLTPRNASADYLPGLLAAMNGARFEWKSIEMEGRGGWGKYTIQAKPLDAVETYALPFTVVLVTKDSDFLGVVERSMRDSGIMSTIVVLLAALLCFALTRYATHQLLAIIRVMDKACDVLSAEDERGTGAHRRRLVALLDELETSQKGCTDPAGKLAIDHTTCSNQRRTRTGTSLLARPLSILENSTTPTAATGADTNNNINNADLSPVGSVQLVPSETQKLTSSTSSHHPTSSAVMTPGPSPTSSWMLASNKITSSSSSVPSTPALSTSMAAAVAASSTQSSSLPPAPTSSSDPRSLTSSNTAISASDAKDAGRHVCCVPSRPRLNFGGRLLEVQMLHRAFTSMLESVASFDELAEINKSKRAFIRYIFHEIRVPFNAIVLGIEQLHTQQQQIVHYLSHAQRRAQLGGHPSDVALMQWLPQVPGLAPSDQWQALDTLDILAEQSQVVSRILNDVLSMSKIEEGKLELYYELFNIEVMIRHVLHSFHTACMDKRIRMKAKFDKLQHIISKQMPKLRLGSIIRPEDVVAMDQERAMQQRGSGSMMGTPVAEQRSSSATTVTGSISSSILPLASSLPPPPSHAPALTNQVYVRGDAYRLRQVVSNLVSNALKFSPSKSCIRVQMAILEFIPDAAALATFGPSASASAHAEEMNKDKDKDKSRQETSDRKVRAAASHRRTRSKAMKNMGKTSSQSHTDQTASDKSMTGIDAKCASITINIPSSDSDAPPAPSGSPPAMDTDSSETSLRRRLGIVKLRISVRDQGVGLSASDMNTLFSDYRQISPHHTQQGAGTGLGLSISKSIIQLHGGIIGVKPNEPDTSNAHTSKEHPTPRTALSGGKKGSSGSGSYSSFEKGSLQRSLSSKDVHVSPMDPEHLKRASSSSIPMPTPTVGLPLLPSASAHASPSASPPCCSPNISTPEGNITSGNSQSSKGCEFFFILPLEVYWRTEELNEAPMREKDRVSLSDPCRQRPSMDDMHDHDPDGDRLTSSCNINQDSSKQESEPHMPTTISSSADGGDESNSDTLSIHMRATGSAFRPTGLARGAYSGHLVPSAFSASTHARRRSSLPTAPASVAMIRQLSAPDQLMTLDGVGVGAVAGGTGAALPGTGVGSGGSGSTSDAELMTCMTPSIAHPMQDQSHDHQLSSRKASTEKLDRSSGSEWSMSHSGQRYGTPPSARRASLSSLPLPRSPLTTAPPLMRSLNLTGLSIDAATPAANLSSSFATSTSMGSDTHTHSQSRRLPQAHHYPHQHQQPLSRASSHAGTMVEAVDTGAHTPLSATSSAPAAIPSQAHPTPMRSTLAMILAHSSSPPTFTQRRSRFPSPTLLRPGIRVLVVEDSAPNRKLLLSLLHMLRCQASAVENGQLCVDLFPEEMIASGESLQFDVILMDGSMPVMNGLAATQILRARGLSIPILAVTGNALSEDVNAFLQAGANLVLTKPISKQKLEEAMARYCTNTPMQTTTTATTAAATSTVTASNSEEAIATTGSIPNNRKPTQEA